MKPNPQDHHNKVKILRDRLAALATERDDVANALATAGEMAAGLWPHLDAAHREGVALLQEAALNAATGTPANALDVLRVPVINGVADLAPLLLVLLGVDTVRELIVKHSRAVGSLDAEARAERLRALAPELLKIEREEEAAIRASEQPGNGPAIARRPDANPAVVLADSLE